MRVLVFNSGSSSLKFELFERQGTGVVTLASGSFADTDGSGVLRFTGPGVAGSHRPVPRTLAAAALEALDWLADPAIHGCDLTAGLDATAHRIVHGGADFRGSTLLGHDELARLAALGPLAPLHNPPALAVIDAARRRLGAQLPLVGVFDTAYYADLPPAAYRYAVPARWSDDWGVRRYGFHGIAHRYMCEAARAGSEGKPPDRVISLQLGRGCSVTASVGNRAVATSMGFTPLEGLVMGTRSGDVDAGAILYVMEKSGLAAAEMRRVLNESSGLLALSGRTADMRELLEREADGDPAASLAIEVFCRRARHYLGGFLAELGGADAIVFGGGIGENCASIRRRIVGTLGFAGVRLRDDPGVAASGTLLSTSDSRTVVLVISVNEASLIASDAVKVLAAQSGD